MTSIMRELLQQCSQCKARQGSSQCTASCVQPRMDACSQQGLSPACGVVKCRQ